MSDTVLLPPGRMIDIPAKMILDAAEHLQHTNARYVSFIFLGEGLENAICIGVSTRRLITHQPAKPAPTPKDDPIDAVLELLQKHGRLTTRQVADKLGIPGADSAQRKRISRTLDEALAAGLIVKGAGHYPEWRIADGEGEQPVNRPVKMQKRHRKINRKDISIETIRQILQDRGAVSSRTIGDVIGIPRNDSAVRGKITETIGKMRLTGEVKPMEQSEGGFPLYELVPVAATEQG